MIFQMRIDDYYLSNKQREDLEEIYNLQSELYSLLAYEQKILQQPYLDEYEYEYDDLQEQISKLNSVIHVMYDDLKEQLQKPD